MRRTNWRGLMAGLTGLCALVGTSAAWCEAGSEAPEQQTGNNYPYSYTPPPLYGPEATPGGLPYPGHPPVVPPAAPRFDEGTVKDQETVGGATPQVGEPEYPYDMPDRSDFAARRAAAMERMEQRRRVMEERRQALQTAIERRYLEAHPTAPAAGGQSGASAVPQDQASQGSDLTPSAAAPRSMMEWEPWGQRMMAPSLEERRAALEQRRQAIEQRRAEMRAAFERRRDAARASMPSVDRPWAEPKSPNAPADVTKEAGSTGGKPADTSKVSGAPAGKPAEPTTGSAASPAAPETGNKTFPPGGSGAPTGGQSPVTKTQAEPVSK